MIKTKNYENKKKKVNICSTVYASGVTSEISKNKELLRELVNIVTLCKGRPYNYHLVAKSTCSDDDIYDPRFGEIIAENKLTIKYHQKLIKDYQKIIDKFIIVTSMLIKMQKNHEEKLQNSIDNLNKNLRHVSIEEKG